MLNQNPLFVLQNVVLKLRIKLQQTLIYNIQVEYRLKNNEVFDKCR